MAKLSLSRPKLPKNFRQTPRLNTPLQQLIQLSTSRSQGNQLLSILQSIGSSLKIHGDHGLDNFFQLDHLGFGEASDFGEFTHRGVGYGFDGVEAGIVEFLDVVDGYSVFL